MTTLRRLLALAGMPGRRLALGVCLGVATIICGVGLMTSAGYLISRAAEHPPILSLEVTVVAVQFFGLSRPLARYLDRLASHDLAFGVLGRIRSRFYARIEPLAPGEIAGFRRGDLVSRMVGDVDALQGLYLRGIGPPVVAAVAGALCVIAAALILPAAGVILACGLLIGGIGVPALAGSLSATAGRRQAAARGELTADLLELMRGAPELAVYGREADRIASVARADRELARIGRRDALVGGLAEGLSLLVAGLTTAGILAAAIAAHARGSLDPVLIVTVTLLGLASFEAVAPLPAVARELSATLASGRRVLELMGREPRVRDPAVPAVLPPGPVAVALEGVTARYAPGAGPALCGLDLRLDPGRWIALVGPSGVGKTTVTNLLFRFLDPDEGRVVVAGRDAREYRQADLRRTFALAGQEAHVFDSTIRENLRLARPGATDAELDVVLGLTRLTDWIATLPDGLDTLVGEEGTRLSGGQRQRLVLARALLVDAPVLVLDEPTAHLDPPTAEALMDDVLDAAADRTVLLITHRPEGLERMDTVVRLG